MPSSGTFAYQPGYDDIFDEAFERCGIDPATLTERHLGSAVRSANLLMAEYSARKITLFDVDEQSVVLTAGHGDDATPYTAADGTILMLECAIKRNGVFTPVFVISRDMYFRIPKRTQTGLPTNVWYNIATNQYNLWTVPENSTDEFHYKRLRRKQDVTAMSETPDTPYVYNNAICAGMAWLLSEKFAPDRYDALEQRHEKALARAMLADREFTDVRFDVGLG